MSDDPKLSQRYRELPREEPPRALDDAILAASRRAVEARPAPLVAPTGRRRWYFPVAAAAVIVLAVAVVAHVDRERPDGEILASSAPAPEAQPSAVEERKAEAPKAAAEAPRQAAKPAGPQFTPDPRRDSSPPAAAAPAPAPAAPRREATDDLRERDAGGNRALAKSQRRASDSGSVSAGAPVLAQIARSPEQWLQGIADLRRQGRHEEADRELAEFRKRYPDYRLSEEMKAKVEKPQ
jgi:hypothetical protein